jgi:hypothetical protein
VVLLVTVIGLFGFALSRKNRLPIFKDARYYENEFAGLQSKETRVPRHPRFSTETRNRIIAAYRLGGETVEKKSGFAAAPSDTLREYLALTSDSMKTINGNFAELTGIAEIALYSKVIQPDADATRAEQLAASIQKELADGAA